MKDEELLAAYPPQAFLTEQHYWNTFGNRETEISARWIVMFLRARGAGWEPFRVEDLTEYYRKRRGEENTHFLLQPTERPGIGALRRRLGRLLPRAAGLHPAPPEEPEAA